MEQKYSKGRLIHDLPEYIPIKSNFTYEERVDDQVISRTANSMVTSYSSNSGFRNYRLKKETNNIIQKLAGKPSVVDDYPEMLRLAMSFKNKSEFQSYGLYLPDEKFNEQGDPILRPGRNVVGLLGVIFMNENQNREMVAELMQLDDFGFQVNINPLLNYTEKYLNEITVNLRIPKRIPFTVNDNFIHEHVSISFEEYPNTIAGLYLASIQLEKRV